jgi:hypothetical protein
MEIPTPQKIKENILIKVVSQEQATKILRLLEEKGWEWTDGRRPTDHVPPMEYWICPYIYLYIIHDGRARLFLTLHNDMANGKIIPAEEFLGGRAAKIGSYNSFCPVCGSPAFDLAFAIECSNPSCQNHR